MMPRVNLTETMVIKFTVASWLLLFGQAWVVDENDQPYLDHFYYGIEPVLNWNVGHVVRICQSIDNICYYSTLYSVELKIPLYSAYVLKEKKDRQSSRRSPIWHVERMGKINGQFEANIEDGNMIPERNVNNDYIDLLKAVQALTVDYVTPDDVPAFYEKGHLNPVADMYNVDSRMSTNTLTNVVPQDACMNRLIWYKLEKMTRYVLDNWCTFAGARRYIIKGVIPGDTSLNHKINVPAFLWGAMCCDTSFAINANERKLGWSIAYSARNSYKPEAYLYKDIQEFYEFSKQYGDLIKNLFTNTTVDIDLQSVEVVDCNFENNDEVKMHVINSFNNIHTICEPENLQMQRSVHHNWDITGSSNDVYHSVNLRSSNVLFNATCPIGTRSFQYKTNAILKLDTSELKNKIQNLSSTNQTCILKTNVLKESYFNPSRQQDMQHEMRSLIQHDTSMIENAPEGKSNSDNHVTKRSKEVSSKHEVDNIIELLKDILHGDDSNQERKTHDKIEKEHEKSEDFISKEESAEDAAQRETQKLVSEIGHAEEYSKNIENEPPITHKSSAFPRGVTDDLDYCFVVNKADIAVSIGGDFCTMQCGFYGYNFAWCYTGANGDPADDYGYCCIDECQYDKNNKGYTCTYTKGGSKTFCSPVSRDVTVKGESCQVGHRCGLHGKDYYWCYTEQSWGYCCAPYSPCNYYGESYRWCHHKKSKPSYGGWEQCHV